MYRLSTYRWSRCKYFAHILLKRDYSIVDSVSVCNCQISTGVFSQFLFLWCLQLISFKCYRSMPPPHTHTYTILWYLPFHSLCGAPLCCFRLLAWHSVTHHSVFSDPPAKWAPTPISWWNCASLLVLAHMCCSQGYREPPPFSSFFLHHSAQTL